MMLWLNTTVKALGRTWINHKDKILMLLE